MVLTTSNLNVSIKAEVICTNLNIEIKPGEVWGLLGPNGSGKTTLLLTLAGLRKPTHGNIEFDKQNIYQIPGKKLAIKRGFLFQDHQFFFRQTVFDYCLAARHPHIGYFAKESQKDIEITKQALLEMELLHIANQSIFTLSGGEKRRLALASLFTQNPECYFLDEPTNHLDLRHKIKLMKYLTHLAQHYLKNIIMTLHDLNLARKFCDKILLLNQANIIYGSPAEVMTMKNLSEAFDLSANDLFVEN